MMNQTARDPRIIARKSPFSNLLVIPRIIAPASRTGTEDMHAWVEHGPQPSNRDQSWVRQLRYGLQRAIRTTKAKPVGIVEDGSDRRWLVRVDNSKYCTKDHVNGNGTRSMNERQRY